LDDFGFKIVFGSKICEVAIKNVVQIKSFVDDLTKAPGTVRMKVMFLLRSAEV
jgi:hypothetical protein